MADLPNFEFPSGAPGASQSSSASKPCVSAAIPQVFVSSEASNGSLATKIVVVDVTQTVVVEVDASETPLAVPDTSSKVPRTTVVKVTQTVTVPPASETPSIMRASSSKIPRTTVVKVTQTVTVAPSASATQTKEASCGKKRRAKRAGDSNNELNVLHVPTTISRRTLTSSTVTSRSTSTLAVNKTPAPGVTGVKFEMYTPPSSANTKATSPSATAAPSKSEGGGNNAAIIGGLIGAGILVILISFCCWMRKKRKSRGKQSKAEIGMPVSRRLDDQSNKEQHMCAERQHRRAERERQSSLGVDPSQLAQAQGWGSSLADVQQARKPSLPDLPPIYDRFQQPGRRKPSPPLSTAQLAQAQRWGPSFGGSKRLPARKPSLDPSQLSQLAQAQSWNTSGASKFEHYPVPLQPIRTKPTQNSARLPTQVRRGETRRHPPIRNGSVHLRRHQSSRAQPELSHRPSVGSVISPLDDSVRCNRRSEVSPPLPPKSYGWPR